MGNQNLDAWRLFALRHKRRERVRSSAEKLPPTHRDTTKLDRHEAKEMKFVAAVLIFALCASSVASAVEHRKLQQNPFPLDLNGLATTISTQLTDNFGSLSDIGGSDSFFSPYLGGFQEIITGLATTVPQQIYDGPLAAASPLAG